MKCLGVALRTKDSETALSVFVSVFVDVVVRWQIL